MNYETVDELIRYKIVSFYKDVKNLAPQNSSYISTDNGRLVDYIYVDGKRVRTNTNNLYNSVSLRYDNGGKTNYTATIFVDGGNVPYYQKAVLNRTFEVATHYGRTEYGSRRYADSRIRIKENKNYLYYMRGQDSLSKMINELNGLSFNVVDSIGEF